MKTLITNLAVAGTIALLLIVACTREIPVEVPATVVVTVETEKRVLVPVMTKVPVTVEVPVEVTREVTVEKRIPVKHEVEVTKEVPVEITREVHVEKRVLVTYEVEVDREVPVTVEVIATREVPATVEVTRIVEVPATVEVTREVAMPVTVQVPVEVTREIDVTRIVEVPATVEVEVTRIVEITPTAQASLGIGGTDYKPSTPDADEFKARLTNDEIVCVEDGRHRKIGWDKDYGQWESKEVCRFDDRTGYYIESQCNEWSQSPFNDRIYFSMQMEGGKKSIQERSFRYLGGTERNSHGGIDRIDRERRWIDEGWYRIRYYGEVGDCKDFDIRIFVMPK